jgi:hypothetical protein
VSTGTDQSSAGIQRHSCRGVRNLFGGQGACDVSQLVALAAFDVKSHTSHLLLSMSNHTRRACCFRCQITHVALAAFDVKSHTSHLLPRSKTCVPVHSRPHRVRPHVGLALSLSSFLTHHWSTFLHPLVAQRLNSDTALVHVSPPVGCHDNATASLLLHHRRDSACLQLVLSILSSG